MSYSVVILRRDIYVNTSQGRERTQRHLVRKLRKAYSKTGLIFNKLDFSDLIFKDDSKGHTVALTITVNPQNSLKFTEMSDSEEVLDAKVFLWNQFADAIINLFQSN